MWPSVFVDRPRPGSRAGSARLTRAAASSGGAAAKRRPSSAPTGAGDSAATLRRNSANIEPLVTGLRVEGRSIGTFGSHGTRVTGGKLAPRGLVGARLATAPRRRVQIVSRPMRAFKSANSCERRITTKKHHSQRECSRALRFDTSEESESENGAQDLVRKRSLSASKNKESLNFSSHSELHWTDDAIEQGSSVTDFSEKTDPQSSAGPLTDVSDQTLLESELASNDGSEVSFVSLGTRIQRVATIQRISKVGHAGTPILQVNDKEVSFNRNLNFSDLQEDNSSSFVFHNSDWKNLLNRNNNLLKGLAKSSNRLSKNDDYGSLRIPDDYDNSDCSSKRTNISCGNSENKIFQKAIYVSRDQESSDENDDTNDTVYNRSSNSTADDSEDILYSYPHNSNSLKSDKYFCQSEKTMRPIMPPHTPDCVLEDINEETSEAELESLTSGYKSAIEDSFHRTRRTKINRVGKSVLSNQTDDDNTLTVLKDRVHEGNTENCSDISTSDDHFHMPFSKDNNGIGNFNQPQDTLLKVIQLPSRSEFIERKNALTRILMQNAEKRKEYLASNTQKTLSSDSDCDPQELLSGATLDSSNNTQNGHSIDEGKNNFRIDNSTDMNQFNTINCQPTTLSEVSGCLLNSIKDLALLLGEILQFDSEDLDHQKILECLESLLLLCLGRGWAPEAASWPALHAGCKMQLSALQTHADKSSTKHIEVIRKLVEDKSRLTNHCEQLVRNNAATESRCATKVELLQTRHSKELEALKQRTVAQEQLKREKWTQHKARAIKESSLRGLETRIKELVSKHRDEVSQLKAKQWQALRELEERGLNQLRQQEQQLRTKMEDEKEEVLKRERDREQQRLDLELRHSAQVSAERLLTTNKEHSKEMLELREKYENLLTQCKVEQDVTLKEATAEKDRVTKDLNNTIEDISRAHESELRRLADERDTRERRLRNEMARGAAEEVVALEKQLSDKFKKQRDRDIERALREMQQQAQSELQQRVQEADTRYRSLHSWCDGEVTAAQRGETTSRARLLEARAEAALREEEAVYLKARLHAQQSELHQLHQMVQTSETEDTSSS